MRWGGGGACGGREEFVVNNGEAESAIFIVARPLRLRQWKRNGAEERPGHGLRQWWETRKHGPCYLCSLVFRGPLGEKIKSFVFNRRVMNVLIPLALSVFLFDQNDAWFVRDGNPEGNPFSRLRLSSIIIRRGSFNRIVLLLLNTYFFFFFCFFSYRT